ncbi:DUF1905 domain-containing protein [Diaminobutyricimonas sp. TR449]|uniref:DUF1905 domain-containing protein n=1 Tax=Diaminobutyricimonas sp. TR449 TaxID=2708076 RepID=UPI001420A1FD|nr:DUF1905 domain-containing protein [Diaminobutyricimonas sp. TR449]
MASQFGSITVQPIDVTFTAQIIADSNSGWLCVQMPDSAEFFGTGRSVKVSGTVDGHDYAATMLPVGGGTHMLALRAAFRNVLGKGLGDEVTVRLMSRSA